MEQGDKTKRMIEDQRRDVLQIAQRKQSREYEESRTGVIHASHLTQSQNPSLSDPSSIYECDGSLKVGNKGRRYYTAERLCCGTRTRVYSHCEKWPLWWKNKDSTFNNLNFSGGFVMILANCCLHLCKLYFTVCNKNVTVSHEDINCISLSSVLNTSCEMELMCR